MSETQTATLADFLMARYAAREEDVQRRGTEAVWHDEACIYEGGLEGTLSCDCGAVARALAEVEAGRRIVEFHKNWPVLVESTPKLTQDAGDLTGVTMRMSQQIAWMTERRYRETFGAEPPTGPILRALALPYADHPDYREEWKP